jgi:hypothetical protein
MSQLSRNCGSLDLSHPYGPSRTVIGRAFIYACQTIYNTSPSSQPVEIWNGQKISYYNNILAYEVNFYLEGPPVVYAETMEQLQHTNMTRIIPKAEFTHYAQAVKTQGQSLLMKCIYMPHPISGVVF